MSNFHELLHLNLQEMTDEQVIEAIYTDQLTGLWNRRALNMHPLFEPDGGGSFVALIDLDSLKWINDTHGHRAGDEAIRQLGQALGRAFGDRAFRISGDEFIVISQDRDELEQILSKGTKFSYAIDRTLHEADQALNMVKMNRTISGLRANRGEMPPWARRKHRKNQ